MIAEDEDEDEIEDEIDKDNDYWVLTVLGLLMVMWKVVTMIVRAMTVKSALWIKFFFGYDLSIVFETKQSY